MGATILLFVLIAFLCLTSTFSIDGADHSTGDDNSSDLDKELSTLTSGALINILEQLGMNIGDNYFSKDELIRLIKLSVEREGSINDEITEDEEEEDTQPDNGADRESRVEEDVVNTSKKIVVTDSDASVWQLFVDQFRSDIAPFLLLIPAPVKLFIQKEMAYIGRTAKLALKGALSPMLYTAGSLLDRAGALIIFMADKLKQHSRELKLANKG